MRGSIWTVVALGAGLALLPAVLDVRTPDTTAQSVVDVIGGLTPVLGLLLFVSAMGVVITLLSSDGF